VKFLLILFLQSIEPTCLPGQFFIDLVLMSSQPNDKIIVIDVKHGSCFRLIQAALSMGQDVYGVLVNPEQAKLCVPFEDINCVPWLLR